MIYSIPTLNNEAMQQAAAYIDTLTKPRGSLGRLEALAIQMAGITGNIKPTITPATLVFAADHGVVEEGVSAAVKEVTYQMVLNMLSGGAAISVFSDMIQSPVTIYDVGVDAQFEDARVQHVKVRPHGTANFAKEAAMTRDEAVAAVEVGIQAAQTAVANGAGCLIIGEVGIGNTTPSSAILAAIQAIDPEVVVGRGCGIDDEQLVKKIEVCRQALALHQPDATDGFDLLSKIGGLEIAAMAGAIIGGAQQHVPVLLDGFICTVAACLAELLAPTVNDFTILSHQSVEIGHRVAAQHLQKEPIVQLDLRLGEGSGAAVAYPIMQAANTMIKNMATFQSANVNHS